MKRFVLALALLAGWVVVSCDAQETKTGFVPRVFKDKDGTEAKYVVFVPHGYKGDKPFPAILFLHGAGETGKDGEKQVKTGLGKAIRDHEKEFPFIAVFPQSQNKTWKADSDDGKRAMAILAEVQKEFKIDDKRVYLTGLSMGGSGSWSHAAAYPDKWAAVAPICGRADLATAEKIKDLPVWSFCGDKDKQELVDNMRGMNEALKKAGANAKYTEYPGVPHNSWDKAYATKELYEWFLTHKRK